MTKPDTHSTPSCHKSSGPDWLFWSCLALVIAFYCLHLLFSAAIGQIDWAHTLSHSVYELMNTIWWGILLGILMISILGRIPREFIMSVLGTGRGFRGIIRATLAGVLLDLCSHGILMVAAKLYERGASIGQVIAFLVSSPWNSFSLTIILIALIGLPWTLAFIFFSMAIAISAGLLFERLVLNGVLPENQNQFELPKGFEFWPEAKASLSQFEFTIRNTSEMLLSGIMESRMVMRWILFGVLLASSIRALVPVEFFEAYFGPTLIGLVATMLVATILEICSEGSTPIAADILTRAGAPGNSFAFLMGGVATDYTEIMILRDTTKSLKIALFLPLVTLPQIFLLAWLMNSFL